LIKTGGVMKADIIDFTIDMMALRISDNKNIFVFYINKNTPVNCFRNVNNAMLKYLNNREP
jgi:hypothetical protein